SAPAISAPATSAAMSRPSTTAADEAHPDRPDRPGLKPRAPPTKSAPRTAVSSAFMPAAAAVVPEGDFVRGAGDFNPRRAIGTASPSRPATSTAVVLEAEGLQRRSGPAHLVLRDLIRAEDHLRAPLGRRVVADVAALALELRAVRGHELLHHDEA